MTASRGHSGGLSGAGSPSGTSLPPNLRTLLRNPHMLHLYAAAHPTLLTTSPRGLVHVTRYHLCRAFAESHFQKGAADPSMSELLCSLCAVHMLIDGHHDVCFNTLSEECMGSRDEGVAGDTSAGANLDVIPMSAVAPRPPTTSMLRWFRVMEVLDEWVVGPAQRSAEARAASRHLPHVLRLQAVTRAIKAPMAAVEHFPTTWALRKVIVKQEQAPSACNTLHRRQPRVHPPDLPGVLCCAGDFVCPGRAWCERHWHQHACLSCARTVPC